MRRHWRWPTAARDLLLAALVLCVAAPAAAQAPAADAASETLYLELMLNQTAKPSLYRFERTGPRLSATADTLRQAGLRLPGAEAAGLIALDDLPGLHYQYDAANQRIAIDVPVELLDAAVTRVDPRGETAAADARSSPGMLLNYDFYASQQSDSSNLTAAGEFRAFGLGDGLFLQSAVARAYREQGGQWRSDVIRLDTQYQWSFPDIAVSAVLGDGLSSSLQWNRALRVGGFRIGREFSLQPYRPTTPLPAFLGDVAVPSQVDLYVNGVRQYGSNLPVGPFQLSAVPGIDGAGNAQLVVTDAYGRTRTLDFPFYASQDVLAAGLTDWSIATGWVRKGYGIDSFSYAGDLVGTGSWRHGYGDAFTAEAHAEGGGGVSNAGLGGLWVVGRAGVVSTSLAHGRLRDRSGEQYALAYRWNDGRFNASADTQRTRGEYMDVAALYGAQPPRVSERALAGFTTPYTGNLSVSYVRLQYPDLADSRYGSVYWSRSLFGSASVNVSLNQNLDDSDDRSLYVGYTMALGGERQVSSSLQRTGGDNFASIDVSQPAPADGGRGWRVQARAGAGQAGGLAEASWRPQFGRYAAGIASFGGETYGYGEAAGGLLRMDGAWFASRDLDQSFALVSTGGVAGVPVLLQNRPIGVTDAGGRLLVSPLNPWQRNALSIDALRLPVDLRPDLVEQQVVPRDRAGVQVAFPIRRVHAAILILHDPGGRPLPVGSAVSVVGGGGTSVVGYDGEAYLEFLGMDRTTLRAESDAGACTVQFTYPARDGLPRIGPLTCESVP